MCVTSHPAGHNQPKDEERTGWGHQRSTGRPDLVGQTRTLLYIGGYIRGCGHEVSIARPTRDFRPLPLTQALLQNTRRQNEYLYQQQFSIKRVVCRRLSDNGQPASLELPSQVLPDKQPLVLRAALACPHARRSFCPGGTWTKTLTA